MPGAPSRVSRPSLRHEREYYRAGCRIIVGIDEAGRGPLAGPVAAAAVALPLQRADLSKSLRGIRDSKQMTASQRRSAVATIKHIALIWGIGHSSPAEIDRDGIVRATQAAMQRALKAALESSVLQPDCLFLDYVLLPERRDIPQVSMIDGDQRSLSIACASVLAKVWRDDLMLALDRDYPGYGFAQNKGYGTPAHLRALRRCGPCAIHRLTFKPVRERMPRDQS